MLSSTMNLRTLKKKNDKMAQRRFGSTTSPRTEAVEGMSDTEALQTIQMFCKSDLRSEEFGSLLPQSLKAMRRLQQGLAQGGKDKEEYILSCLKVGLVTQFLEVLHLPFKFLYRNIPVTPEIINLQWIASWCLAAMSHDLHGQEIMKYQCLVPTLADAIEASSCPEVREMSMWCLGNIFGANIDCSTNRRTILRNRKLVNGIIKNMEDPASDKLLNCALWTSANLMAGDPAPGLESIHALLHTCVKVLQTYGARTHNEERDAVLEEAFRAVRTAILNDPCVLEHIGKEFIPLAADLAMQAFDSNQVKLHAVIWSCFATLSKGSEQIGDIFMKQNIFGIASRCLEKRELFLKGQGESLLEVVCLTVNNLLINLPSGSDTLVRMNGLLPNVIDLATSQKWSVKCQALSIVCNHICASKVQQVVGYLKHDPAFLVLFGFLKNHSSVDVNLTLGVLKTVRHVIEVGCVSAPAFPKDSVVLIEDLQFHKNAEIQKRASFIIDKFFNGYEDLSMTSSPNM